MTFDEIHAMTLDRDYTALVKTRGLSDGYIRYLKIAPGGDTGWHSHPGIVFALIQSGIDSSGKRRLPHRNVS